MNARKPKTKLRLGRPPLPDAERRSARVTVRLAQSDVELLDALCAALDDDRAVVFRRALDALADSTALLRAAKEAAFTRT